MRERGMVCAMCMHSYELFCSGGLRLVKSFIISSLVKPPPSSAGELKFFPESNRLVVRGGLSILELGGGAVVVVGGGVIVVVGGGAAVVVGGGAAVVVGGGAVVVVGGGAGPCTLVGVEEIGLLGIWGDVQHTPFISFPFSDGICSVLLLCSSSKTFVFKSSNGYFAFSNRLPSPPSSNIPLSSSSSSSKTKEASMVSLCLPELNPSNPSESPKK